LIIPKRVTDCLQRDTNRFLVAPEPGDLVALDLHPSNKTIQFSFQIISYVLVIRLLDLVKQFLVFTEIVQNIIYAQITSSATSDLPRKKLCHYLIQKNT